MTRRTTIHELAETLSICCSDEMIADLMEATLSAEDNERLSVYQANLAEALFESLTELRPDCVVTAQERWTGPTPKRSLSRWLVGLLGK